MTRVRGYGTWRPTSCCARCRRTVAPKEAGGERPTSFDASGDNYIRLTLAKAPAGFKGFPEKVAVKVAESITPTERKTKFWK